MLINFHNNKLCDFNIQTITEKVEIGAPRKSMPLINIYSFHENGFRISARSLPGYPGMFGHSICHHHNLRTLQLWVLEEEEGALSGAYLSIWKRRPVDPQGVFDRYHQQEILR